MVLSPHLDDGVLSCGYLLARNPGAQVVTVFAGAPNMRKGTEWDTACGFAPGADVVSMRRHEDEVALNILGATPVWLDFLDAQYLDTDSGIMPTSRALTIVEALVETIDVGAPQVVAAPLGLFHDDHVRTYRAWIEALRRRPHLTWLMYADVPYRAHCGTQVQRRLAGLEAEGFRIDGWSPLWSEGPQKRQAVASYRSQLAGLAGLPGEPMADIQRPEHYYTIGLAETSLGQAR